MVLLCIITSLILKLMQAVDGGAVCVALANQHRYCMVNIQTGQVQLLFTLFIHSV